MLLCGNNFCAIREGCACILSIETEDAHYFIKLLLQTIVKKRINDANYSNYETRTN